MIHKYEPGKFFEVLESSGMQQHIPEEQPSANFSGTPAAQPLFVLGKNGPAAMISGTGVWTPIKNPNEKDWVAEAVDRWQENLKQEQETRKDSELCQVQARIDRLSQGVQHAVSEITKLRSLHLNAEKVPELVQLLGLLLNRVEFLEDLTKKHNNMLEQNVQLRAENQKQRQQLQTLLGRRAKRKVQVPKSATAENS